MSVVSLTNVILDSDIGFQVLQVLVIMEAIIFYSIKLQDLWLDEDMD